MTTTPAHPRLAIVTGADSGMGKAVAELLAKAERDCFVGNSLTVTPVYEWTVT